jgi:hypothetical protein
MIRSDAPPEVYRNPFLAQAMMNLNRHEQKRNFVTNLLQEMKREKLVNRPD